MKGKIKLKKMAKEKFKNKKKRVLLMTESRSFSRLIHRGILL